MKDSIQRLSSIFSFSSPVTRFEALSTLPSSTCLPFLVSLKRNYAGWLPVYLWKLVTGGPQLAKIVTFPLNNCFHRVNIRWRDLLLKVLNTHPPSLLAAEILHRLHIYYFQQYYISSSGHLKALSLNQLSHLVSYQPLWIKPMSFNQRYYIITYLSLFKVSHSF